jgi:hypothetical protein
VPANALSAPRGPVTRALEYQSFPRGIEGIRDLLADDV